MKTGGSPYGRPPSTARSRQGFSLLELFLVITILSVISVLTFPLLRRPLNESVVQDAGQQLMRELAAARTRAIERGAPLLFQYQPGTGQYYVGPVDQRGGGGSGTPAPPESSAAASWASSAAPRGTARDIPDSSESQGAHSPRSSAGGADEFGLRTLPAEVVFAATQAGEAEMNSLRRSDPDDPLKSAGGSRRGDDANADETERTEPLRARRGERDTDTVEWSIPVRFYPSGRVKPAKWVLRSPAGIEADFTVHGMAGRFQLSPVRK